MSQTPIFVGMDLGTHKTSVACSNGSRFLLPTAVGWPKDAIAERMLGKSVVFGADVETHQRALTVVRPFAKAALKFVSSVDAGIDSEQLALCWKAARLVVERAVREVVGTTDAPVYGVIGAPSQATPKNHQVIMDAAKTTLAAALVVYEPFTVAYGMQKLDRTLVVDIGAGTIDICPMLGAYPDASEQRTIPLGGDMIDEAILREIQNQHPDAMCSLAMARQWKEKYGTAREQSDPVVVSLNVRGVPQSLDVTHALDLACSQFVEPIVEGICHVTSALEPEYQRALLDNVLLAGGGSRLIGLDRQIECGLERFGGGNVTRVHDSAYAGAVGALKLAMDTPIQEWDRVTSLAKAA